MFRRRQRLLLGQSAYTKEFFSAPLLFPFFSPLFSSCHNILIENCTFRIYWSFQKATFQSSWAICLCYFPSVRYKLTLHEFSESLRESPTFLVNVTRTLLRG